MVIVHNIKMGLLATHLKWFNRLMVNGSETKFQFSLPDFATKVLKKD